MDFDAVLASPVEFHPLATDAATGQSTDLRPLLLHAGVRKSPLTPVAMSSPAVGPARRFAMPMKHPSS